MNHFSQGCRTGLLLLLAMGFSFSVSGAETKTEREIIFREPFTLRLPVDKTHVYEESFGKVPYAHEGKVYLFKGDAFGINLGIKNAEVTRLEYVPAGQKADLDLRLTQETQKDGSLSMMLTLTNHTVHTLQMAGLMTRPGHQQIMRTTILPVEPGLTNFESWPHPIIQLMLRDIRVRP